MKKPAAFFEEAAGFFLIDQAYFIFMEYIRNLYK